MPKSMALDLANYYVALGRAVPRSKWVTELTEAEQSENMDALDNQLNSLMG